MTREGEKKVKGRQRTTTTTTAKNIYVYTDSQIHTQTERDIIKEILNSYNTYKPEKQTQ